MFSNGNKIWRKLFESSDVKEKIDFKKILNLTESLLHNKKDLEKLLSVSIIELEFLPKDLDKRESIFCTGNIRFINVFKKIKLTDKKKQINSPFVGIKTKDANSVDVYDIIDKKIKTISLKSWKVVFPFIMPITEDNVLLLDSILNANFK
jgi:hypothetical protein